jgi:hypothetical protein
MHIAVIDVPAFLQNRRLNPMKQSRRGRLDDDLARKWLAKHEPKQVSKPNPKPQRRER